MPSSNFLGLLQAIAGNGHDVSWSRALNNLTLRVEDEFTALGKVTAGTIHRNLYTVATGIYPVEAEESLTTRGWIVEGWLYAVQVEQFSASVALIEGEKVQIYADVFHTQYPEAFSAAVALLSGEKVQIYSDTFHTQAPEAFSAAVALLGGEKVGAGVTTDMPSDDLTTHAWITGGELNT